MTLSELIDALEKTEGPSEQLDVEIWRLIRAPLFCSNPLDIGVWTNGGSKFVSFHNEWSKNEGRDKRTDVLESYTSSIDAALTLVPEGFYLDLHDWTWAEEPAWCASLQSVTGERRHISQKGATASLALCIACLKARQ